MIGKVARAEAARLLASVASEPHDACELLARAADWMAVAARSNASCDGLLPAFALETARVTLRAVEAAADAPERPAAARYADTMVGAARALLGHVRERGLAEAPESIAAAEAFTLALSLRGRAELDATEASV